MRLIRHSAAALVVLVVSAAGDATSAAAEAALKIAQAGDSITVTSDGRTVLGYQCTPSPLKPYVKQLATPAGVQVLRDSPSDHKHHHGLMFAIGVDGVDFWAEGPGAGTQRSVAIEGVKSSSQDGLGKAGFVQQLEWTDPRGPKTLLVERRAIEVAVLKTPTPLSLVTWNSRLRVAPGVESVKFGGHHYYGLGMRFLVSMDQGGRFFNSAREPGEVVRGSERLVAAKWCAYTAKADGKPVTVAIFDHPKNPRYPNKMFTMTPPFAYLSATLNLWKEPMDLRAGQDLDLRYGVALWDREVPPQAVEAAYVEWAGKAAKELP
ncbi:MAG: DUF6807 family protein [Thermoguttaceae bacterium]|jgi:hypothetical protein